MPFVREQSGGTPTVYSYSITSKNQTIDISTISGYQNFTVGNNIFWCPSAISYREGDDITRTGSISCSYNSSTGIITATHDNFVNNTVTRGTVYVVAF